MHERIPMSAKPVAQKLLIKPGTTVWASDTALLDLAEPLPDGVRVVDAMEEATTALVRASDSASLRVLLDAQREWLARPNAFWIAYPKGNRTDINRDSLWPILADYGMRPITQVALNDVWSGLRFRPLKEGEEPFSAAHDRSE
jgi:hypothetical protein